MDRNASLITVGWKRSQIVPSGWQTAASSPPTNVETSMTWVKKEVKLLKSQYSRKCHREGWVKSPTVPSGWRIGADSVTRNVGDSMIPTKEEPDKDTKKVDRIFRSTGHRS